MSLDTEEIVVTGTGHIYRAPVGTPFPRVTVAPSTPWVDLGYASENGAAFSFGRSTNPVMGWQSLEPLRIITTQVPKTIAVELLQWNEHTHLTAMGGGTWSEPHTGEFEYDPPDPSFIDEFAYLITGTDGAFEYRIGYKRVMASDKVDFAFVRSAPVQFPVTVSVLAAPDGSVPFIVQTTDDMLGDSTESSS